MLCLTLGPHVDTNDTSVLPVSAVWRERESSEASSTATGPTDRFHQSSEHHLTTRAHRDASRGNFFLCSTLLTTHLVVDVASLTLRDKLPKRNSCNRNFKEIALRNVLDNKQ